MGITKVVGLAKLSSGRFTFVGSSYSRSASFIINRAIIRRVASVKRAALLFACLAILAPRIAAAQADAGDDVAAIRLSPNMSVADITYAPGTNTLPWQQKIGNGIELGFLAGNFSGTGADDLAAICFAPNGDAKVQTTNSPGTAPGDIWQRALTVGSKLTYYLMQGDFNGDGRGDIAAFYTDESQAAPDLVRAKITYGPVGAQQTADPTPQALPTEDWNLGAARKSAFVTGDFLNSDGIEDLAIISQLTGGSYQVRFVRGPNGETSATSWTFPAGTVRAFRAGDFDNNGSTDLVAIYVSTAGDYTARIAHGPSGTVGSVWNLTDRDYRQFIVGDFDHDGRSDIAGITTAGTVNTARIEYSPAASKAAVDWTLAAGQIATFLAGNFNAGIAPGNLQASDNDPSIPNIVRVTYTAVPGSDSYRIFRAVYNSPSFSVIGDIAGLSFDDSTAVPGVIYVYKARAVNAGVEGPDSNTDTGYRWNNGQIPAPTNVQASDGTNDNAVEVRWFRVGGATGFRVARSTGGSAFVNLIDVGPGTGSELVAYDDATAVPGVVYNYRVRSLNGAVESGDGPSNIDSGYRDNANGTLPAPTNVQASDGTTTAGIDVTWNAVGGATGYIIFRAESAGEPGVIVGSTNGITTFRDTTTEPCYQFYYYVRAVRGAEQSADSARDAGMQARDGGCAIPPLPATQLSASDGTSQDFVLVTWTRSRLATAYQLYRSQFANDRGAPLGPQTSATQVQDISAVPGVRYYYSVKAINQYGESDFSNSDIGFRAQQPGEDPDCDGDGVSDEQEQIDGTGVCDPGSFQLHLKSPAFTRYNTFLNQQNFLELIANGTRTVDATVTVFALNGSVLATTSRQIEPLQEVDIDIRALVGQADTYGVVRVDFNSRDAGATLIGRMSHYRAEAGGTYSFAFARELRNPTRGTTFSTANAFDPQGQGFLVPNWAEVVNLDTVPRVFTHNVYNQEGALVQSKTFLLEGLGARDIQAGHEFGEGVYVSEFFPIDGAAKYFASVTRYSSNAPSGTVPDSYNFAFALDSKAGNGDKQYMRITNQTGGCYVQTNWVEVMNVRDRAVTANLTFRDNEGNIVGQTPFTYAPRSQYHFQASALLPQGKDGSVEVSASEMGSLITQSLVYFHDSCGSNTLQTAYASPGRIAGQDVQAGSFNTNLNMVNQTNVIATSAESTPVTVEIRANGQLLSQTVQTLGGTQTSALNLNDASIFGTSDNQYGTITLRSGGIVKRMVAENLRVRESEPGKIDFVMMTAIQ